MWVVEPWEQPTVSTSLQASIPFAVVGSNQQIEAKGKKVRGRLYPWGVVEVENPEHNDFLKLRTMLMWVVEELQGVVTLKIRMIGGRWYCINCWTFIHSMKKICWDHCDCCFPRYLIQYDFFLTSISGWKHLLFTDFSSPPPPRTHMQDLQEVTQDLHYENFRSDRLKRGGRLSSHGYVLPLSPAYVLVCLLAFLHLPPPQTADFWWEISVQYRNVRHTEKHHCQTHTHTTEKEVN